MKRIVVWVAVLTAMLLAFSVFPQSSSEPTKVIKIIDPDNGPGTDYVSLNEFARREKRDLVKLNEIAIALCRSSNGSPDGPAQFDKWVTDSLRYVMVVADTNHRATAKWDTTKYRIIEHSTINSECIDVEIDNMVIDGIQMRLTGGGPKNDVIDPEPKIDKLVVKNCFLWLDIQDISGTALDPGSDVDVFNCIIKSSGGGSNAILLKQRGDRMPLANVCNNTFIGWQRAIKTEGLCRAVNNLVRDCKSRKVFSTSDDGEFTADSDFNSTNHAGTAIVKSPRSSTAAPWFNGDIPADEIFVDPESNDYRFKQTSVFIGIGVGPEASAHIPGSDMKQQPRSGKNTDLGPQSASGEGERKK